MLPQVLPVVGRHGAAPQRHQPARLGHPRLRRRRRPRPRDVAYAFKSLDYALGHRPRARDLRALRGHGDRLLAPCATSLLGVAPTGRGLGDRMRASGRQAPDAAEGSIRGADRADALRAPRRGRLRRRRTRPSAARGRASASRRTPCGWRSPRLIVVGASWVCDIQWGDLLTFWEYVPAIARAVLAAELRQLRRRSRCSAPWARRSQIALAATLLTLMLSLVVGSLAARNVAPNRGARGRRGLCSSSSAASRS